MTAPLHGRHLLDAQQAAAALDALVRTTRQQTDGLYPMGERALQRWREGGIATLHLKPNGLHNVDSMSPETLLLEHEGEETAWIQMAFLAGLRSVTINEETTPDDLCSLAIELGALDATRAQIESFRAWTIAESHSTVSLHTETSFIDVFDALDARDTIQTMRHRAVDVPTSVQENVFLASTRETLRASLEMYTMGRVSRAFEMLSNEEETLRAQNLDIQAWFLAELDALLSSPALQSSTPPDRLARRLLTSMGEDCDEALLERLVSLFSSRELFHRTLCGELGGNHLGEQLGQTITPTLLASDTMSRLIDCLSREVLQELLAAALLRSEADEAFYERLFDLAMTFEPDILLEHFPAERLTDAHIPQLLRLLLDCAITPEDMARYLGTLPAARTLQLVPGLPAHFLESLEHVLHHALAQVSAEEGLPLLPAVAARTEPLLGEVFFRVLLSGRKDAWSHQLAQIFMDRVLIQFNHEVLLDLARSRRTDLIVRTQALRRLEHDQQHDLLRKAVEWRVIELFEPNRLATVRRNYRLRLSRQEQAEQQQRQDAQHAPNPSEADS